ncbi:hypothetical protein U1E44_06235 [Arenibacter sp. GZD96]|uniref:hypothetical protein n=1 Tax=Aurantibrevibacter litoralis TaxID=3106030 RepID=UPI002AFEB19E|nr:hypothetical protein [Arenibacter sp. GZD-96]MEA1785680.1 hypothetical protein [Arenibacter sp. GZD-96]
MKTIAPKPLNQIGTTTMTSKTNGKKEMMTIPVAATQLLKRKSRYISLSYQLFKSAPETTPYTNLKSRLV